MSTVLEATTPPAADVPAPRIVLRREALIWPLLLSVANAVAFFVVRPNVGDLQAALARESAAAHGVGLTYWFQWFGGGAAPGNYSVITPALSTLIGAPMLGVLATVAITPLAYRALAGTAAPVAGTWIATYAAGGNIWSGRIPFALGMAFAIVGLIGVRERRTPLAIAGIVCSSLCSPVSGAFLAFVLAAAFLVEREYRRLIFWVCASCGAVLLFVAIVFGNPGRQDYAFFVAVGTAASAWGMLLARPSAPVRVALWCTGLAAVLLAIFPNGMGSNFERLPWICLPAAVVATATAARPLRLIALAAPLIMCATTTVLDLVHSSQPSASLAYYGSLISQLDRVPDLRNYRLEVVEDPHVHTAAYALLGHAALAGGYETQAQNGLNSVLRDRARLNSVSFKVWLDNNAVGYVAINNLANGRNAPEYDLVKSATPAYLTRIDGDRKWTLYRVGDPSAIVARPERLLSATQAQLRIQVPCACAFPVRVRYSKFLEAKDERSGRAATIENDGTGWSVVTTTRPGVYAFRGQLTHPFSR